MEKKKSIVISVLGLALILYTVLGLYGVIVYEGSLFFVGNPYAACIGLLYLISGIGLLMLKGWARISAIIVSAITAIVNIRPIVVVLMLYLRPDINSSISHLKLLGSALSLIAFSILTICILTRPKVKEQFKA